MTTPKRIELDAATGTITEVEMTAEEIAGYGWIETAEEETSGERSASDNVEEEGEPNDPIPDSGNTPSDN